MDTQLFGIVSIVLSIVTLLFAVYTLIASQAAARQAEQVAKLRVREARLQWLADHPEEVTEEAWQDIKHGTAS